MRAWLLLGVVLLSGCVRAVRQERREQELENGVPAAFVAEGPRRWDFGDGTAAPRAVLARHAFARAGRYVVQAFDGEALTDRVEVVVGPRAPPHAVPPEADFALIAGSLAELRAAVDFSEQLSGASAAQRFLDEVPTASFAMEQGSGRASVVDDAEGLGVFSWPGLAAQVGFVGITDEARALTAFEGWLAGQGWRPAAGADAHGWTRSSQALRAFVDRGTLYAAVGGFGGSAGVRPELVEGQRSLVRSLGALDADVPVRIAHAPALGLVADPARAATLTALPSGGVTFFARPVASKPEWDFLGLHVRFSPGEAAVEGVVHAARPLWKVPDGPATSLLGQVPGGAVVVLSSDVEGDRLSALVLGDPESPLRQRARHQLGLRAGEFEALLASLSGRVAAVAWLDLEGFLRSAVEKGGRPDPKVAARLEAGLRSAGPMERLVEAALVASRARPVGVQRDGLHAWSVGTAAGQAKVAVSPTALSVQVGPELARPSVNLLEELGERFPGAFAPGHLSAFVDVGQLLRDLQTPIAVQGLDPRQVLLAQSLATLFLSQLTTLDFCLLDLGPTAGGAEVHGLVRVRAQR